MLPSPKKFRHRDISKPIAGRPSFHHHNHKHKPTHSRRQNKPHPQNKKALPFAPPPSRVVVHKCPDVPNQSSPPHKPLTTLMLSLPLAQKIHKLILASRQIESLAQGLFGGYFGESEVATKMEGLEETYDNLREEVECELETAWVNAGLLPENLPMFPPSGQTPAPEQSDYARDEYTVDKDLKRKREEIEDESRKKGRIEKANEDSSSGSDSDGWMQPGGIQPVGIMQAMIPLGWREARRLRIWKMEKAWKKKGQGHARDSDEGLVSPRGIVFTR